MSDSLDGPPDSRSRARGHGSTFRSRAGVPLSPRVYTIRPAVLADSAAARRIERAAAARFAGVGMAEIARGSGMSTEVVHIFVRRGGLFLMLHGARPVGFVAACTLDGAGHIAELDVVPKHAGQKLGSRLIDVAADWARAKGCQLLTLTTYRDVPWNAPYYARLGFRECALEQFGQEHREVWEGQRAMGLCMERRLLMARPL